MIKLNIYHGGKSYKISTRYLYLYMHMYLSEQHCFACCKGQPCNCNEIKHWSNHNWFEKEGLDFWSNYIKYLGHSVNNLIDKNMCLFHYKQFRKF